MPKPRNPFIYGVPVPPSRFVGRGQEVRTIFNQIAGPALGSVAISGEHRMGRTSLLHYVVDPDVAAGWGITPDRYILIYLDCQSISGFTPTRFWHRVLDLISRSVDDGELKDSIESLRRQPQIDHYDFDVFLDTLQERGQRLVLLLDEFERAIRMERDEEAAIVRDFLSGLRSVTIGRTPRVTSLIIATRDPIDTLCRPVKFWGSPFYHGFASVRLKAFTRREADDLVDKYLKGTGVDFSERDRAFVYEVSKGHPYWLQDACFKLFEKKLELFE